MQSEPCKSPLKFVKNVKSLHSLLSLKYPTVTFLPFNLHISNYQRFIKTQTESLTKINIPNSVINIGNSAFSGCSSLTKIIIPSSVVNMDGNPFLGWDGDLHNESKAFVYERQVLFNKDKTTLIAYRSKKQAILFQIA